MLDSAVTYSIVVPVYNSTQSVIELVQRIDTVFTETIQNSYEIILVDDASPNPETWPVLLQLAETWPQVTVIQLMRNFGKTGAVLCGFAQTSGDYVFTIDDDLQHKPEDMPRLIEQNEHDVVMGVFLNKHHTLQQKMTSRVKDWFDHQFLGKPRGIQNSPYKLYRARVVQAMLQIQSAHPFIPAMLFYVTRDVVAVNVSHDPRKYGKTNYSFIRRLKKFMNLLINNSPFLLRMVSGVGLLVALISFVGSVFYIIRNLIGGVGVPGWTSLIVVILVTNGLLLFAVGVIGEYLVRIITGIESRPPYIIRTVAKHELPHEIRS